MVALGRAIAGWAIQPEGVLGVFDQSFGEGFEKFPRSLANSST